MRPAHLKNQKLTSVEIADIMCMLFDIANEDYPGNGIRLNVSQERMHLTPGEESSLEFLEGDETANWSREERVRFIKSRIVSHLR